jgi:hypothetical protein
MNLRKLFGLQPKNKKQYEYANALHMWEDDYLMIELLPKENLDFIKNETKRIDEFGKEHFDGVGFADITIIGEKPVKTIDKQILINQIDLIFRSTGLQKIEKVVMQDVGLLAGGKVPLGYGSNKFAVILEGKMDFLENIWLTGRTETEAERRNLKQGLKEFGKQFGFIGVNWYKSEYYDLNDEKQIEEFIKNSC